MSKFIFYLPAGWIRCPSPPPGSIYEKNWSQKRKKQGSNDAFCDRDPIIISPYNRDPDILAIVRARNRGRPMIRDGSLIEEANPRGKPKETIYSRGTPRGTPTGRMNSRGDPRGDPSGDIRAGTPPDKVMET